MMFRKTYPPVLDSQSKVNRKQNQQNMEQGNIKDFYFIHFSPSTYKPDKLGIKSRAPSYSFSYKDNATITTTPGPGNYFREQRKSTIKSEKQHGFSLSRRTSFEKRLLPGPQDYNPKIPAHLQRSQPSYSIGGNENANVENKNPGPGAYDLKQLKQDKQKGLLFGHKMQVTYQSISPGPARYDGRIRERSVSTKIGTGPKLQQENKSRSLNPGPGYYEPQEYLISRKNYHNNEVDIMGRETRINQSLNQQTPGPGEYGRVYSSLGGPRAVIKKYEERMRRSSDTPGPGEYFSEQEANLKSKSIQYGFGMSQRTDFGRNDVQVGPGSYSINESKVYGGKKFNGDARFKIKNQLDPGPGFYNIGGTIGKLPNYMLLRNKNKKELQFFE